MHNISFVKSDMAYERRIGILPKHLLKIKYPNNIFIEKGYGEHIGIEDFEYEKNGANIVSRSEALKQKVIVDPKIGDATYLEDLEKGKVLFGYFHAVQNKKLTDILLSKNFICYAWEDLNTKGKNLFFENNILAGQASAIHASLLWGRTWLKKNVAIFGRGNTAQGAAKVIESMGGSIDFYTEEMLDDFKNKIHVYDAFVNAVLWDEKNDYYILSKDDINKMRKNSLVIDISCDIDGAIEFSNPRTLDSPMVELDDIFVYSLVNSPTLYPHDASNIFSNNIIPYLNYFITMKDKPEELDNALIIDKGTIVDRKIINFQKR